MSTEPSAAPSVTSNAENDTPSAASDTSSLNRIRSSGQDSQVLHDTLNVINEHITDLRMPSNGGASLRAHTNDSGSEYSIPLEQRMSYIQGEETDDEDDVTRSRSEVESWSADEVAENLFAAGVEQQHCEVFRDQEISGEVLLGMDQSSLFIKAFDLGSVGRRLKTWHKIKAIQEEVTHSDELAARRTTATYSERSSDKHRSLRNTLTNAPNAIQTRQLSTQSAKASPTGRPQDGQEYRPGHVKRPSAASVRDLHHSRRYSSTDYRPAPPTPGSSSGANPTSPTVGHHKAPSFDRGWTLNTAFTPGQSPNLPRPQSSAGLQDMLVKEQNMQDSAVDMDRGYFSGTDADGRKRNVLRKRDSGSHTPSSYADEQRVRSATAISRHSRHSRYGSMDSYREGPPSASQKYYSVQNSSHRRTTSTTTTESVRPPPPLKDTPPAVTRLDTGSSGRSPLGGSSRSFHADWLTSMKNRASNKDMRSPTSHSHLSSAEPSPRNFSADSPAPSSNSAGPSFEFDSADGQSPSASTTPGSKASNNRRKGKKETSAYTRGLLKIPPSVAKEGSDYSGWMKKKSSNLMTTWKPRFFVLKGRRLSYYYSENDTEEKGLIDISFHRVLPADNEKLTGLHATITSAVGGPSMPSSVGEDGIKESNFIFKLVPPRAGLSRAVTFTKPMVHYFSVPNVTQGRLWMAAMMKATIDRDDSQPITTTYQQKTISLSKAKQMRHRPPALMGLDETIDEHQDPQTPDEKKHTKAPNSLGIFPEGAGEGTPGADRTPGGGELPVISPPGSHAAPFGAI